MDSPMTNDPNTPRDPDEALPPRLRDALAHFDDPAVRIPPTLDAQILSRTKVDYARRVRFRPALPAGAGVTPPSTAAVPVSTRITYAAVNVYTAPHGKPLACYEMQIVATTGDVALVGIEGGESAAFNAAPYYDPRALQGKRII